ncbi:MAG: hypothetical protein HY308_09150 [Gammaproteobacteria bacterium]|nr:hypothetical protein [Gammaproteobacteria bacterium]
MVEELAKSVRQQIEERLSSPLLGTFAISWSLWNYKFFVVLFSSASVTRTFALIDTLVFPDIQSLLLRGLLYPLLTTAAYIFLYPYPARVVYRAVQITQKRLVDERRAIEGQTLLTIQESRLIRAEREQFETAHINEIDRKNNEIDRLRSELAALRSPSPPTAPPELPVVSPPAASPAQPASDTDSLLSRPVDSASLAAYTKWKFPHLEVSESWNDKAVRDLDKSRYPTLREVDAAVQQASAAVNAYHLQKPEWFKYGTDFITKSLGFVDPSFRSRHAFAKETLDAFLRHEDKLASPKS